ncbi:DUF732 domain-containing protein [Mycolicibacterium sp. P1-18]|uniref:DUF732 domain-containing protein n=1 Tax=Mycolicibacterium sp. P1-18 TaxID=2024615 RepID=UPI001F5C015E|nr:DUF732 domain-containing protein [Mycolicibacterium sp. P1-18]
MGDDVMATIGMPSETTAGDGSAQAFAQAPAVPPGENPELVVTPAQRSYLDALTEAGLTPSSELSALNIGSCVCQAKAAKQSDQEVWDFVLPMVRGDVRDSYGESVVPPAGHVNSETSDYIRIATETLC